MPDKISREVAEQVAVGVVKKKKNSERINVATVDQNDDNWIVRGTCLIDVGGIHGLKSSKSSLTRKEESNP
jgi:hypothetical protein